MINYKLIESLNGRYGFFREYRMINSDWTHKYHLNYYLSTITVVLNDKYTRYEL